MGSGPYPVGATSKSHNCRVGEESGTRRLDARAWCTTQEFWGVNGISIPWGDAKRVA
jgi:hypothetical protein